MVGKPQAHLRFRAQEFSKTLRVSVGSDFARDPNSKQVDDRTCGESWRVAQRCRHHSATRGNGGVLRSGHGPRCTSHAKKPVCRCTNRHGMSGRKGQLNSRKSFRTCWAQSEENKLTHHVSRDTRTSAGRSLTSDDATRSRRGTEARCRTYTPEISQSLWVSCSLQQDAVGHPVDPKM